MAGVTWTGQVNFTDSSDVGTTGVATLTLTPDCGWSNLPALASGTPGLPPTLRNVTVNQVDAGSTCPASTWSLVTAGGAGTASVYDLVLYVNKGAAGESGSFAFSAATDLVLPTGVTLGGSTDGYTVQFSASDSSWHVVPPFVPTFVAASSFATYSGNAPQATIATLNLANPNDWYPDCAGWAKVTGTANTCIELAVMMGDPIMGQQVAYAPGVVGAINSSLTLVRDFPTPLGSGYGKVTGSATATPFHLVARQTASGVSDAWAVTGAAGFSVASLPVTT